MIIELLDTIGRFAKRREERGLASAILDLLGMVLGLAMLLAGAFGAVFGIFQIQDGKTTTGLVLLMGSLIGMIVGLLLAREK